jgi:hypothetical protein
MGDHAAAIGSASLRRGINIAEVYRRGLTSTMIQEY